MRYDVDWIGVRPGERFVLEFINSCRMTHNLVVCRPENNVTMRVAQAAWALGSQAIQKQYVPDHSAVLLATSLVNPNETQTFAWVAPEEPGDYPFVCTVPGHALTMTGTLHVGALTERPKDAQIVENGFPASAIERAKQPMQRYRPYMDGGPTMAAIFSPGEATNPDGSPARFPTTNRGIAIRLGDAQDAGVLFDTELLRYTAGWIGGFAATIPGREDERAEYRSHIQGVVQFTLPEARGGRAIVQPWDDPRPKPLGQLPKELGRYKGHWRAGDRVTLSYTLGSTSVRESPILNRHQTFQRDLEIGPSSETLELRLTSNQGVKATLSETPHVTIHQEDGLHFVRIQPRGAPCSFSVGLSRGNPKLDPTPDFEALLQQTSSQRSQPAIETKGLLGAESGPYVVDTLTLPYENPWNALLYVGGHDFFSNGDAALCTSHGDVWTVRGIDAKLNKLIWKRVATGLANPLGLRIVEDQIYVVSLHEITRLHDVDGDGIAEYYESFNADLQVSSSHHRFVTDLQTDAEGNFYYLKCSDEGRTEHGGSVVRVRGDGSQLDLFATGLRNPNGLGMGPGDTITFGKQQGTWIPTSGIHMVREGGFYGYIPSAHRDPTPNEFEPPLCWIPHGIDNSCGGQVWAPQGDRWGPLGGALIHFSYGKCQMFLTLHESGDGTPQGGVIRFPGIEFESGAMRGRFRELDGQLYVSGLRGWQTTAAMPGCFQRVRYTGKPVLMPSSLTVESKGVRLDFFEELEPTAATDPTNYALEQWQYRWTRNYGSPEFKITNPDEKGHDPLEIHRVTLSDDRRSILIHIDDHQPVMQMAIEYDLRSASGAPVRGAIYNTIHWVP